MCVDIHKLAIKWFRPGDNCIIAWGLFYTDPEARETAWLLSRPLKSQLPRLQGPGSNDAVACLNSIARFLLILGEIRPALTSSPLSSMR